ncbi:MAG: hypothetical protein GQ565_06810 [Candidatus Aegiribacteria sp.]|nr:hypothetical protein [Candidatus Aegiribacteria sp.]
MKPLFIVAILCFSVSSMALELEVPEIGGQILLDYLSISRDSSYNGSGKFVAASNRFRVRKATLEISGTAGELIRYEASFGISSCQGSGTIMALKEAGIRVMPFGDDRIILGMGMFHVRRGFELGEDCGNTLTTEKPMFKKVISPVCHPLGALLETDINLGTIGGIEGQIAYANGNSGTLNEEHDANFALFYRLPVEGLAIGGFYNDLALEMNPELEGYEDASRYGFGLDYEANGIAVRTEIVHVKGVLPGMRPQGCSVTGENVENICMFAEAGYSFDTGSEAIPSTTPYINYQSWDRWSNADSGDYEFSWITGGVKTCIGSPDTYITLDYRIPAATPDGLNEDASVLTARFGLVY